MPPILELARVAKTFTMHLQGGVRLPIVRDVSFSVRGGECIVLSGPSGAGKSSILKMIFGTYRCDEGQILVTHDAVSADIATAQPRDILRLRNSVIGYVSQFLRAVPRVAALDVVAEAPSDSQRREHAAALLARLNIPERLWSLPPATFSGGEQQRVNIARGFLAERPLLLLDEPTASLDADNRAVVVELIAEKKRQGAAMVAIVHDQRVCDAIADRVVDVTQFGAV